VNPDQQHRRNRLLAALRPQDYALLKPHLQIVLIGEGDLLHLPGEEIKQVYFLHRGHRFPDGDLQGRGRNLHGERGTPRSYRYDCGNRLRARLHASDGADAGSRLTDCDPHFRRAVSKSEAISDLLTRYHMALMTQVQQTSLCNSVHDATSRLSRLLLLLNEQGNDDTISFTQERLAAMLGLRRTSVTLAAQTLQSRRLIRYRRGRIEIVDRKGLKAAACECYAVVSRRTMSKKRCGKCCERGNAGRHEDPRARHV
jgi:Crp-like helix-turn-helix domain